MTVLRFMAWGRPVPKGNITRSRTGRSYDPTKGLKAWTKSIRVDCARARGMDRHRLLCGPIHVELAFLLPRPKRLPRPFPTVKPDLDKLTRAVLDALTGCVYRDDAQVCGLVVTKRYAPIPKGGGCCRITVTEEDPTDG